MKVEIAPVIEDYAMRFGKMFELQFGMRLTKDQMIAAFIETLAAHGDILIEEMDSSTIRISSPSLEEEDVSSDDN